MAVDCWCVLKWLNYVWIVIMLIIIINIYYHHVISTWWFGYGWIFSDCDLHNWIHEMIHYKRHGHEQTKNQQQQN